MRSRHFIAIGAIAALVLLSGCATINVHSTVTADQTIEEYQIQINTSSTVYGYLNEGAKDEGHDSLRDMFLSNVSEEKMENVDYDEEFHDDDQVTLTLTIEGFDPGSNSSISIREAEDGLVYEDQTFVNESAQSSESGTGESLTSGLVVHYYLEMPGEITDSNANDVEGNTAEWHQTGSDAMYNNRISAKSEKPNTVFSPGFGVGATLVAFGVVAGLLHLRRKRRL